MPSLDATLRVRLAPPPALFIGRERERERLEALLRSHSALVCGVAGVGKTALALLAAAGWEGPVVFRKLALHTPLAELYEDLGRHLGAPPLAGAADDGALIDSLDGAGALWLLDDLHLLEPAAQHAVFQFAARLRRARLLATSRELLRLRPDDRDVLVLKLDGLDEPHGRALWTRLDELYGPTGSFERAWQLSKGNPFLLRQAHVTPLDDEQPLAATWDALSCDERRVAGALALAHVRLPVAAIAALLPGERGRAALRGLATRLVAEVDLERGCTVHDLFRELALSRLAPAERVALHAALAEVLRDAAIDPVERAREVGRQLCEAGAPSQAGAYLVDQSAELIRRGAAVELLAAFDAIPAERRSPDVHIARARVRVRLLELRGTAEELDRMCERSGTTGLELVLARGQIALLLGRGDAAEHHLLAALDAAGGSPVIRTRALVQLAMLRVYQGRGDEARALLDDGERGSDRQMLGQLSIGRAITYWIDERHRDTAACVERALTLLDTSPDGMRSSVFAHSLLAAAVAQLGDFAEASRWLRRAEAPLRAHSDLRVRNDFRGTGATIAFARGQREEARAELDAVVAVFERVGYLPAIGWARAWLGRVLLSLGRRRDGFAQLAAAQELSDASGLAAIAQTAARSRAEDVLSPAWLAQTPSQAGACPARRSRAHLAAALRAASTGDAGRSEQHLAAAAASDPGDAGLDRALAVLARAVLARSTGDTAAADRQLAAATAIAIAGGADAELVPALYALVSRVRVEGEAGEWPAPPASRAQDLVVDSHDHLLHVGGRTIALGKNPLLRAALYAFAVAPTRALDKEALANAIWGAVYDPVVHEHSLKANMHRLRRLLDGTGISLVSDAGGYRLDVPGRLLFISTDRAPATHV